MRVLNTVGPQSGPAPIDLAAFADRLDPLIAGTAGPVAVAVSGGPDSMALLYLADHWARQHNRPLLVYTVDHGLRPSAAAEAHAVAAAAASCGRRHRVLAWTGPKPATGLQQTAREARYRLLLAACRADGAAALLLAHHLDDQAETLLHRIGRDTGPDGLAGMARSREVQGVRLLRPLLDLPKARLLATCEAAGLTWSDDPSNHDPRFARTGLRELAPVLSAAGVTPGRLGRLAAAMATARRAMDRQADAWMAAHAEVGATGAAALDLAALAAAPPLLRDRLVDRALRVVGGSYYPARGDRLARLLEWIATDRRSPRARTLAGCRIEADGRYLTILRDWRQAAGPVVVAAGSRALWDGRFEVDNPTRRPVRVGVCGAEGWRRWRRIAGGHAGPTAATIPHAARLALPAVVDLDGVIALPHLVAGTPALSGWVGDAVRVRFRPSVPVPVTDRRSGVDSDFRPSLPCNGRQAT